LTQKEGVLKGRIILQKLLVHLVVITQLPLNRSARQKSALAGRMQNMVASLTKTDFHIYAPLKKKKNMFFFGFFHFSIL
jgi:hypothetical protein